MKDVAKAAGVSTATVSHVLNETRNVSPAVAARVEQAVRRLDYRRNAVARSLRQLRTRSYGLDLPDVSNNFFAAILKGV
jgi:LacI family transcriptional regulator